MRPPLRNLTLIFIMAMLALLDLAIVRCHDQHRLPDCTEDEILAPVDYPYHDAGDLTCLHIDAVRSGDR